MTEMTPTTGTDRLRRLGAAVRARRRAANLSPEALAEAADVDPAELARIEAGLERPSFRDVVRLARSVGATPSDLYSDALGPAWEGR